VGPAALDVAFADGIRRVLDQPSLIRPVFQPIVDLRRGAVAGYEALARFGVEPLAPPDRWFAAARTHGTGDDLEAAVLAVCLEARHRLPANRFLAVNADPRALAFLPEHEDLGGVVVELTSHEPSDLLLLVLDGWRERGARVAVDHAGADLAWLLELRPDVLKLDVGDVDRDEAARATVELATTLAGRLGATVVAEGIERLEQLDALVALGVPLGQGWALGRPHADWQPCDQTAAGRVRAAAARRAGTGLVALTELRPTVPGGALAEEEAAALFRAEPALDLVVAVDGSGRPDELHVRTGVVIEEALLLVAPITSTPADVAARAVERPEAVRFAPVVCVDDGGRFVGVVPFERLVAWLAAAVRPSP